MMSRTDSIAQLSAHAIGAAISVGLLTWLATTASATDFGRYSLWLYTAALATIPIDGGWRTLITRETSRATPELRHLVAGIPRMAAIHAAVVALMISPIALFAPKIGLIVLTIASTQAFAQFQSAHYRGLGQFKTDAAFLVSFRASSAISTYLGYSYFGENAEAALTGTAVGQAPVLLFYGYEALKLPVITTLKDWLTLTRESIKFLSIDAATTLYLRSPLIFLGLTAIDPALTGTFALAHRLIDLTAIVMAPIGVLYFNWARRVKQHNMPSLQLLLRNVLAAGFLVGITSWACRSAIELLAVNILGKDYSSLGTLIPFISVTVLLMAFNCILTNHAIAVNKTDGYAKSTYVALCSMLIAAAILIPMIGTIGAAAATTAYELTLAYKLVRLLTQKRLA